MVDALEPEVFDVTVSDSLELISPADLPLDPPEFRRMAACYDALEFCCALKPWVMMHRLDAGNTSAVYLDSDMEVFASLEPIVEAAQATGVALVPHTFEPLPGDGLYPMEREFLRFGTYNAGCLVAGSSMNGRRFLDWWSRRLARDCIHSDELGLFMDQRWLDLVPPMFDAAILCDPGVNVAYWNRAADIRRAESGYAVADHPLRLFHYSGFDPTKPAVLSRLVAGPPRADSSVNPALAQLCREYSWRLLSAGYTAYHRRPYGYGRTNHGFGLDRRVKRLFRAELAAAEVGAADVPPDPFTDVGSAAFVEWLIETKEGALLPRYLDALYGERCDVRGRFPVLAGTDRDLFFRWVREFGVADAGVPAELVAAMTET